jgi:type I restriction enzyme, R subunit
MPYVAESIAEEACLQYFDSEGYEVLHGADVGPDTPGGIRTSFSDVIVEGRLTEAVARLNPQLPESAVVEAVRRLRQMPSASPSVVENNRRFHQAMVEGIPVEHTRADGSRTSTQVWFVDFEDPARNDWLVVNQFTVIEGQSNRRPDIVVFLNGLPVAVFELKNPVSGSATLDSAYSQLQTYMADIPTLFAYNGLLAISDGMEARAGTLTSPWEWFKPWKTVDGEGLASDSMLQLEVLVRGVFHKRRLLDMLRSFIVFEGDGGTPQKKIAGYHQYHAVNRAVESTLRATAAQGDKRAGVIWHTQGSGKSLSMVFYAAKIMQHPAMQTPTLVVLTDRNDLDGQLFGTFSACKHLLRETPVQANDRAHVRELLSVRSGGIVFTTIQKFMPDERGADFALLSDRRNIVCITDEAHRSQYGRIDGFARHIRSGLSNASFIGFTGTPVDLDDRNTRNVFGDYIDIYDISQAVADGATVPILYEARLAKIDLDAAERPHIDAEFEEVTEAEETDLKEAQKRKWSQLEKVVGSEKRMAMVAQDIVDHFALRQEAIQGKAMVVCMSRRICVDLHNAIAKLRPEWSGDGDDDGEMKVVMTGSASDPAEWQPHIRNKPRRMELAKRFKREDDPFKVAIVRDMWLTGFDVPSLHSMYLDKPMHGHSLMQAIARVNRVFRDKPGGLVVDYLGVAESLKRALMDYTGKPRGKPAVDQADAVPILLEKVDIAQGILHGFDYSAFLGLDAAGRMQLLADAVNFLLADPEEGPDSRRGRFVKVVADMRKAFALAVPHEDALAVRDEIAFFEAVAKRLQKLREAAAGGEHDSRAVDAAIQQIVSKAITSDEVVDIFDAAGLDKPDISILSDEFLEEVQGLPQPNLAVEALRRLLEGEIKGREKNSVVLAKSFSEMLEDAIQRYQNRSISAAQVIEELIRLARDMREAANRGEELGLSVHEIAFYDALEVNDSAVKILGDDILKAIAHELVETVRNSVSIDWAQKESARARLRRNVRRVLRKHGYPPDKAEQATKTVVQQAELTAGQWA